MGQKVWEQSETGRVNTNESHLYDTPISREEVRTVKAERGPGLEHYVFCVSVSREAVAAYFRLFVYFCYILVYGVNQGRGQKVWEQGEAGGVNANESHLCDTLVGLEEEKAERGLGLGHYYFFFCPSVSL